MTLSKRAFVLSVAGCLAGLLLSGRVLALDPPTSGDPALIAAAQAAFEGKTLHTVSVAYVDQRAGTVAYANFGADNHTQYEIGSISKTFVGHLFAVALQQGEVTEQRKLGTLVPLLPLVPANGLTLRELATHHSGLPSAPSSPDVLAALAGFALFGTDPYPFDYPRVLGHANISLLLGSRGSFSYSNLGCSLLGHALAARRGTTYKQLLQQRLLTPLGLHNTSLPETAANLPPNPTTGWYNGRKVAPWTLHGYAPSGGVRSDIVDMASYARQLLAGTVPGLDALAPKAQRGTAGTIGWFWWQGNEYGTDVVQHRGNTGGFSSSLYLDRGKGTAVVILSNTAGMSFDRESVALLQENGGR